MTEAGVPGVGGPRCPASRWVWICGGRGAGLAGMLFCWVGEMAIPPIADSIVFGGGRGGVDIPF